MPRSSLALVSRLARASLVALWIAACGDDSEPDPSSGSAGRGGGAGASGAKATGSGGSNAGVAGAADGRAGASVGGAGAGGALEDEPVGGSAGAATEPSGGANGGEAGGGGALGGDSGASAEAGALSFGAGQAGQVTGGNGGHGGAPTSASGGGGTGGTSAIPARLPCNVAALLANKCQECHTDPPANEAPFPLLTFNEVVEEAVAIKAVVLTDEMPYQRDPLNEAEKAILVDWIDAGTPPSSVSCE